MVTAWLKDTSAHFHSSHGSRAGMYDPSDAVMPAGLPEVTPSARSGGGTGPAALPTPLNVRRLVPVLGANQVTASTRSDGSVRKWAQQAETQTNASTMVAMQHLVLAGRSCRPAREYRPLLLIGGSIVSCSPTNSSTAGGRSRCCAPMGSPGDGRQLSGATDVPVGAGA